LHGSHGFAREYVELAKELSRAGVVAVAPCWFAPGEGPGLRLVSPLTCPTGTPPMTDHQSQHATQAIDFIMRSVRDLSGVQADQVAVFGHSRGAGAAWNYVLQGGKARAIILNSAGYTDELIEKAAQFDAAVLILHGENDTIGPMTKVERARKFESALRKAGKPVEAVYYRTGEHGSLFVNPTQHADEVRRMRIFLGRWFRHN
jgi:dienelactone hydrolase